MAANIYGTVLCCGDSLISGARDESGLGMPQYLGRHLSEDYDQSWIGIDEGVNGETSAELLRRFYKVVRSYPEVAAVVVCIGTNDAKAPGVDPNDFADNMKDILRITRVLGKPLILCALPLRGGFGAPDVISNKKIAAYNRAIRRLSKADPRIELVELDRESVCNDTCRDDGLHFNQRGNMQFAGEVKSALERLMSDD